MVLLKFIPVLFLEVTSFMKPLIDDLIPTSGDLGEKLFELVHASYGEK